MTRPPLLDDDENDEALDDEGGPDRVVEADGPAYDVAFEILDMVSLYGSTYALGYPVTDGEFGDTLEAHRWLGAGQGFERVKDANLVDELARLSVLGGDDEDEDDDATVLATPQEPLAYAIVDTVAVDGVTWTLGRAVDAPEGTPPDVLRYDGHGHSFSLATGLDPEVRARIEDEIRGFEKDEATWEQIEFDLRRIVELDDATYAVGYRYEDLEDDAKTAPARVWRYLGDGQGFELLELNSSLHREVTRHFPGLFEDEREG